MPRIDINKNELREGDRVIIAEQNDEEYIGSNYKKFFRDRKVYGTINSDYIHDRRFCGKSHSLVNFEKTSKLFLDDHMLVKSSILQRIDPEMYETYEQFAKEAEKWLEEYMKKLKCLVDLPASTENFISRKFKFEDRNVLNTNMNFVLLGKWNKEDGNFNVSANGGCRYLSECCSFTQTSRDIEIYIPEIWLRYFGWTTYDLVEWLKFLSKCEIGFDYEYRGVRVLPNNFIDHIDNTGGEKMHAYFTVGEYESVIYPTDIDGQFHSIRIKASDDVYVTYMRFIALRYIYNHQYWTIPGHAMQIKRALGNEVTHWQALLLAHLYRCYNPFYSFGSQQDLDPRMEYHKSGGGIAFGNHDRHLNPFQDADPILRELSSGSESVNESFKYVYDTFKREELRKFFDEKDYVGLFNYTKEKIAENS